MNTLGIFNYGHGIHFPLFTARVGQIAGSTAGKSRITICLDPASKENEAANSSLNKEIDTAFKAVMASSTSQNDPIYWSHRCDKFFTISVNMPDKLIGQFLRALNLAPCVGVFPTYSSRLIPVLNCSIYHMPAASWDAGYSIFELRMPKPTTRYFDETALAKFNINPDDEFVAWGSEDGLAIERIKDAFLEATDMTDCSRSINSLVTEKELITRVSLKTDSARRFLELLMQDPQNPALKAQQDAQEATLRTLPLADTQEGLQEALLYQRKNTVASIGFSITLKNQHPRTWQI